MSIQQGLHRTRKFPTKVFRTKRTTKKGKMVRVDFQKSKLIPRWPLGGFPRNYTAKLRYVEEFSLDVGMGLNEHITYSANDLFDPNVTGTGHQPMGRDQLFVIYEHAVVMGSKAAITWLPEGVSNTIPAVIIAFKNRTSNTLTTKALSTVLEQRNRRGYQIGGLLNAEGMTSFNQTFINFSPRKDLGIKDPIDESGLYNTSTAGPTIPYFFEVYALSIAGNDPGKINFIITIDYLCKFFDLKQQEAS